MLATGPAELRTEPEVPAVQALPATESLDEAFARLRFTEPRTLAEIRPLFLGGPVPEDLTLLSSYAAVLTVFLDNDDQLAAERITVAGEFRVGRDLAEEVRRLQRERPDARAQWVTYCGETLGGVKDPLKHTVASLRRFLLMV